MPLKYQGIATIIRQQILEGTYPAGGQLPTEVQLCESFSASRQTIRQALQQLVDEGLIVRRQGSGSRVIGVAPTSTSAFSKSSQERQRVIAVIPTYISDYIFPGILREIEIVLADNHCSPLLFSTHNHVSTERKVLQRLLTLPELDGILVEGTKTALPNPNLDLYRQLQQRGIPIIFMHGGYADLDNSISVLDDNYNGGYTLVEYLQKKGHSRIAGFFKSDDIQGHQRYAGYAAAMRDLGLHLDDRKIFWYNTEMKKMLRSSNRLWVDLIENFLNDCSAVVCYNDEIASYLLQILQRRGVKVPEEMALVSFDNSQYSEIGPCHITSLSHGKYNVGRMAAQLLMDQLNGQKGHCQVAPWELIEKESS